jgi:hypothetical protein
MATVYADGATHQEPRATLSLFNWDDGHILISMWCKHTNIGTQSQLLCGVGADPDDPANDDSLLMYTNTSDQIRFRTRNNGSVDNDTNFTVTGAQWNHFAIYVGPWDNTSQTKDIWLNGSKSSRSVTLATNTNNVGSFVFAQNPFGTTSEGAKFAYGAVYRPASAAEAASIVAELQTLPPDDTTVSPTHSWP